MAPRTWCSLSVIDGSGVVLRQGESRGNRLAAPPVLYHYTSWEAAESILPSQRFRASAHDCTNDIAELAAADATILDEVRNAFREARGIVSKRVLAFFLEGYGDFRLGASRRAYLVCFSSRRDDPHQWCRYGSRGAGVCLGLRIFEVDEPAIEGVATGWMPVSYGDFQLRRKVRSWLKRFIDDCDRAADMEHNWRLAVDALGVSAAAWAIATKHREWLPEREVRGIFLSRNGARIVPAQEQRPDGSIRRYFTAPLTSAERMPVRALIIGPNQDQRTGYEKAMNLLLSSGYTDVEQKIVLSATRLACDDERR